MKAALRLLATVAASVALTAPALAADRAQGNSTPNASTAKQGHDASSKPAKKAPVKIAPVKRADDKHTSTAKVRKDRPMPPAKVATAQNHAVKPHQRAPKATPTAAGKGNKAAAKGHSTAPGQTKKTAAAAAPEQKHHRLSFARFHRGDHKDKDKGKNHDKKK